MKAWDDLKEKVEHKFFTTMTSEYWLERGVKIERFVSGKIEIRNTLRAGDFYVRVNQEQLNHFVFYGWEQGVCKVNVDEYCRKLSKAQERIDRLEHRDTKGVMPQAVANHDGIRIELENKKEMLKEAMLLR